MEEALLSDDVFANVNDINNTTSPDYNSDTGSIWPMVSEIIDFIICVVNAAANVFLIFVILKYKRLRKRTNFYLLNSSSMILIYSLLMPLVYVMIGVIRYYSRELICICFWIEEWSCFMIYFFSSMLALDWYLVNYKKKIAKIHQRLYQFDIVLIHFIGIVRLFALAISNCSYHIEMHHSLSLCYIFSFVVVMTVNLLKIRQPSSNEIEKTRYALIASNVIVLSWFPTLIYDVLFYFGSRNMRRFVSSTELFPKIFAHGNTIYLLYILGKSNRNFQMAYNKTLRKNVGDYEQYEELDVESEDYEAVIEHHVNTDSKIPTDGCLNKTSSNPFSEVDDLSS